MKKFFIFLAASAICLATAGTSSAAVVIPPEPEPYPTNVEQCKKGGWQNYGGLFKNQGDCVSYVATQGKNLPDGPTAQ